MPRESLIRKVYNKLSRKDLQTLGAPSSIEALVSAIGTSKTQKNKYQAYREFLKMDPELNNALTRLALLTQFAYKGIFVKPGKKMTEDEEKLEKLANKEANDLDFRGQFFSIAKHLLRDGDEIFVVAYDKGIQQIQPLPISKTTIVDKKENIGKVLAQILGENFYILNELSTAKQQVFPEKENQKVYHVALDNRAEEVYDILNRWTFGVWSESPLECLKTRVLWKQAILITDILWRYRNIPREVHELDTSIFAPEKFAGANWEARITAATTALETYLKAYANKIKKKKVDQGYVIGTGTKITVVESKTKYTEPNELMEQINRSIREGMGAYEIGKGTFATELVVASYVVLLPELCAFRIKRVLLEMLRRHMREKHEIKDEDLDKLDIKLSLVLDIFKGEMARTMAIIAACGTHTIDELRAIVGDSPLTDEQVERIVQIASKGRQGDYAQTLRDMLRDAGRRQEPAVPETPQARRARQET